MFIDTLEEIRKNSKIEGVITPYYDGLSIVNIGSLVLENFNIQHNFKSLIPYKVANIPRKQKVLLFLIDALGYNLLKYALEKEELKSFKEIVNNGILTIVTSTFPSTTATALPSIYTSSTPSTHGALGYRFYAKEFGDIINALFQKQSINRNCPVKYDPEWLVKAPTIFEIISENNIPNFSIVRSDYLSSTFDKAIYKGSKEIGYITLSDMLEETKELLKLDKAFINLYWWSIDALSHRFGPFSQVVLNEIKFLDLYLNELLKSIDNDTLLIITADHGQIETTKDNLIDLSLSECAKNIILPITDVRAPYIYVREKFQNDFLNDYKNLIVLSKDEAFNLGLFGDSMEFEERVGDYVIIAKDGSFFSYISDPNELELVGKHGNLTEDEMLVPLILYYK